MMPKISVIMPVYNSERYLRRALNSVCNQTFRDLEILCINDGSTDESPAILTSYAARDPRIRVITHEKNRGYACAMNSGLDSAKGETIGIVDSDDVIGRNFFAELWMVYEAGSCDIVKGRLKLRRPETGWSEFQANAAIRLDPRVFNIEWTSAIYRKDFIRKHQLRLNTVLKVGQDMLFLYQLMGHEPRICFSDTAIYYYLVNDASMCSTCGVRVHLESRMRLRLILKDYLPIYPTHMRRRMFERCIVALYSELVFYKGFDWESLMPEIKKLLADDSSYCPQSEFPLLKEAFLAENPVSLLKSLRLFSNHARIATVRQKRGPGR